MQSILIVEDNWDTQLLISSILRENGYQTFLVADGKKVISKFKECKPDIVLLDIQLPGEDGITILRKLKDIDKDTLVIMISGTRGIKNVVETIKLGAYDYVRKPFDEDELLISIKRALKTKELNQQITDLKKKLYFKKNKIVIGNSPLIKRILNQIDLIAPTKMSVIIQGDSGTGKEVFANLIHKKSLQEKSPFVALDCGAIPDTLVESELFGHEKGSFTGALASKAGKFEEANGGTLLLDEITNMPIQGQAKLLRVLEEKQTTRIGGIKTRNIDIRVIATSNKDFLLEIKQGNFREDLYHRLNEFQITLPSLSKRKDDIPLFAHEFLKEANEKYNKKISGFSPEAMQLLLGYKWSGNVRELKNAVNRAVITTDNEVINPEQLSIQLLEDVPSNAIKPTIETITSLKTMLQEYEYDIIQSAIEMTNGNKTKAAKLLDVNIRTLHRKMI
ncbi:MAG: sigma-54-dependent Fis family transcriptional regulator [Candidatus Cloacimonetes bacterium]|jgi:DNA-binding NtrC family response regulator|nr:sigma-54-dependent Fis family transcriptional regulator [Candidatus Cloacimonadota bacterium]MBT4333128.1 sigma-54-dependent Fis family transcriptional regulator [Candidatus Cloacimonadota bacterium]